MTLHTALGSAAALVATAFCLSTLERWLDGRRPYQLAWTLALAMFALASLALAAGAAAGWNEPTYRTFYLFGAVTNVPVLALGSVYLLAPREVASRVAAVVGLAVALGAGVVLAAPFTAPLPEDELARGSEVFGPLPRVFAAVASGGGAAVVVGGALWSAFRRRRLVGANILIALGTLITGASGLLNSVADEMTAFALTLVAGITVIFAGFLLTTRPAPPNRKSQEAQEELPQRAP